MASCLEKDMKIFDSHFHIFNHRFPISSNQGFLPDEFTCDDYKKKTQKLNIIGGAIVSGSFQEFDQSYLKAALKKMGSAFVGITQLPHSTGKEKLLELQQAGVRGVRFNLRRGIMEDIDGIEDFSNRIYEQLGWHAELYVDGKQLADLYERIIHFPSVVIDHLGLSKAGFPALLKLVEQGARVKASGFGRLDFDAIEAIRKLMAVNPNSVMFGTDLPSTRALRPFKRQDIKSIMNAFDEPAARKILYRNAVSFYQPKINSDDNQLIMDR
jgi:predicted TIM-barrel fold metal-dependent hydrolase